MENTVTTNINTVEDFFSVLMDASLEAWKYHLSTSKYSAHMALDEFYKDMPELVDLLIEDYMGIYGRLDFIEPVLEEDDVPTDPIEYMDFLRGFIASHRHEYFEYEELQSDIDAILSLIDSTKYKLQVLVDSRRGVHAMNRVSDSADTSVVKALKNIDGILSDTTFFGWGENGRPVSPITRQISLYEDGLYPLDELVVNLAGILEENYFGYFDNGEFIPDADIEEDWKRLRSKVSW